MIDGCGVSCEIALRCISMDLPDDNSALVQVMAWCRQATSHYLSLSWPSSLTPYGVSKPQWVKDCGDLCMLSGAISTVDCEKMDLTNHQAGSYMMSVDWNARSLVARFTTISDEHDKAVLSCDMCILVAISWWPGCLQWHQWKPRVVRMPTFGFQWHWTKWPTFCRRHKKCICR